MSKNVHYGKQNKIRDWGVTLHPERNPLSLPVRQMFTMVHEVKSETGGEGGHIASGKEPSRLIARI